MENKRVEGQNGGTVDKASEENGQGTMSGQGVVYSPLLGQAGSEEDDDWQGATQGINGRGPGVQAAGRCDVTIPSLGRREGGTGGAVDDARKRRSRLTVVVVVVVGAVVCLALLTSALLVELSGVINGGLVRHQGSGDWTVVYNDSYMESAVVLVDVDGDAVDDVLLGVTDVGRIFRHPAMTSQPSGYLPGRQWCSMIDAAYPCMSDVVALSGRNGSELWRAHARAGTIFANCRVDVNSDGRPDCILTGRQSTAQAVDVRTGRILWVVDADEAAWSGHLVAQWSVFRALDVDDVDGDGVRDVMIAHGGNQSKQPWEHERAPGRIVLLSGASGLPLGRYLALPHGRETYMSPLRHRTRNGTAFVLLGTGGETVSGDLLIVRESQLLDHLMGDAPLSLRPVFRGREKGVMVAPVLVDMTNDGTPDLLVSAFEGVLALYDGDTMALVWRRDFPGMESYSTPAPGHYDDDGVLDVQMVWGYGNYDKYLYADVYVVSGQDGSVLWRTPTHMPQMNSDLVLRTTGPRDLFLVRIFGNLVNTSRQPEQRDRRRQEKRHGIHSHQDSPTAVDGSTESYQKMCFEGRTERAEWSVDCRGDLRQRETGTVLVDGEDRAPLPLVSRLTPQPYRYMLSVPEDGRHCHPLSPVNTSLLDMCVVMAPKAVTGAMGDLDGDGGLDLVLADNLEAWTVDDLYSDVKRVGDVIIRRKTLEPWLAGRAEWRPLKEQPWTQFMGAGHDNVYREGALTALN